MTHGFLLYVTCLVLTTGCQCQEAKGCKYYLFHFFDVSLFFDVSKFRYFDVSKFRGFDGSGLRLPRHDEHELATGLMGLEVGDDLL